MVEQGFLGFRVTSGRPLTHKDSFPLPAWKRVWPESFLCLVCTLDALTNTSPGNQLGPGFLSLGSRDI